MVLDESLHRLAATGPEFGGGLSNHGPMASEALVRLGRADDVEHWVSGYLHKLDAPPPLSAPIDPARWPDAIGHIDRVADWQQLFDRQLADRPWRDVLADWWPRLLPGLGGGATHGVIRTSHVVRSLADEQTPERLAEFGRALAYWAACYLPVSGALPTAGALTIDEATDRLPATPPRDTGLITERLADVAADERFAPAVTALRPPTDVRADLDALIGRFVRVYLAHAHAGPIPFLHGVTAPTAVGSILDELPAAYWRPTYDTLWQVSAALYSGYAAGVTPHPLPTSAPAAIEDIVDRAVATGDEHAIKLAEACLRLHAHRPDELLLHAATPTLEP